MEAIIIGLLGGAFLVGLISALVLFEALVLIQLWGWFIVPFFHLSSLNYPLAIGLCAIFTLMSPMPLAPKEQKHEGMSVILVSICRIGLLWLIGYIAHLFM